MDVCENWIEKYADIDFKGGLPEVWTDRGGGVLEVWTDRGGGVLEVWYENGYLIDVGYNRDLETYFVSLIKDDDWAVPVRTIAIRSEGELPQAIRTAVDIAAG